MNLQIADVENLWNTFPPALPLSSGKLVILVDFRLSKEGFLEEATLPHFDSLLFHCLLVIKVLYLNQECWQAVLYEELLQNLEAFRLDIVLRYWKECHISEDLAWLCDAFK